MTGEPAAPLDWREFLTAWSRELLACPEVADGLPPEVVRSGWLGYPPAPEAQLRAAERRLRAPLPPSYRAFLGVTNGWRATGFFVHRLFPVEELDWYRARHQVLIDAWLSGAHADGPLVVPDAQYFVYGAAQRAETMRPEYLQAALQLSELFDTNVYLLNPQVVTPAGEWEAWFHAGWLAGAERHRSFWELMVAERQKFLALAATPSDA
jgi:hypothetical protein